MSTSGQAKVTRFGAAGKILAERQDGWLESDNESWRPTSAGRLGGLRILWGMAELETMSGDIFCPGNDLNLEKMKQPL